MDKIFFIVVVLNYQKYDINGAIQREKCNLNETLTILHNG